MTTNLRQRKRMAAAGPKIPTNVFGEDKKSLPLHGSNKSQVPALITPFKNWLMAKCTGHGLSGPKTLILRLEVNLKMLAIGKKLFTKSTKAIAEKTLKLT
jgi:hypothetical protein